MLTFLTAPAQSLVSYEARNFTDDQIHDYMGPPSPEREKNWHDLLQGELGETTGQHYPHKKLT